MHRRRGEVVTVSYGELRAHVADASRRFEPEAVVGIVASMTFEAVVAYLAVLAAGGCAVTIPESFSAREIRKRLAIAGASSVVTQDVIVRADRTIPLYERVVEAEAESIAVIRTDAGRGLGLRAADAGWEPSRRPRDEAACPWIPRQADAAMHVLFSSGTTGDPKAIPWTHLTPLKAAMDAHLHFDVREDDVLCWPTSLGWMMGPWLIFASLLNGAALALYEDVARGEGFGAFVREAEVTFLGVVPSLVSAWRASGCMEGVDWTRVRRFASTGEPSDPADMRYLSELGGGKPVLEYIGGTELGGGYLTGTLVEPCWPSEFTTPALGLDVVILGADGKPSDEGELYLVPPSVGLSNRLLNADHHAIYHAGVPRPGLRRHGDAMVRTDRGTYRALGRTDDTMNLGGIKVSSREIEDVVRSLDQVREVAAVSTRAQAGGPEHLALFVVARDGASWSPRAWKEAAQEVIARRLNPLFRVEQVRVVEALPRTASNKIMRRALRARLDDRKTASKSAHDV